MFREIVMNNESTTTGYTWQPITDLPEDWPSLSNPELASLARVWSEQRAQLSMSRSVREFNERLLREWSIETGIIERLYTIDRGVTTLLIQQGLDATLIPHGTTDKPPTEIVRIIKDHRYALEGIFDFVKGNQLLTTSYIRQLHQVITRSQEYVDGVDQFGNLTRRKLTKGNWKKLPNNPTRPDGFIHEYCPPLNVAQEMDRLILLHREHQEKNIPPEVGAAWLHHRFTQIHPFEDGNGRVARALATIVFLRAMWFPLVINRDQRSDYINSLEYADNGDLKPLVGLFAQIAKRSFVKALELSEDVLQSTNALPDVVSGILDVYQSRRRFVEKTYQRVEFVAEQLVNEACDVLKEVTDEIRQQFSSASIEAPPILKVDQNNDESEYYYTIQIVKIAKDLDYWANVSRRRLWVRLHIIDRFARQKAQIIFSFHYLGKTNRGVMVCVGFIDFPETKPIAHRDTIEEEEQNDTLAIETHRVSDEPFYLSYSDESRISELRADFREWIKTAVAVGLAEWVQRS
jgi:Fic family protein